MTRSRVELLLLMASALAGCGITQRAVEEVSADGGVSGGAQSAGGQATGGTNPVGSAGHGGFGGKAGLPGTAGEAGVPSDTNVCSFGGNPAPVLGLSAWEYRRSVVALTGTATSDVALQDAPRQGSFAFAMDWNLVNAGFLLGQAERQGAAELAARLLPCSAVEPVDATCAISFIDSFVGHAFRRPLNDDERSRYVSLFKAGGVPLVVEAALMSPLFLHKIYLGKGDASVGQTALTSMEVAGRIAYLLAGEPPDAELFEAATRDELTTPDAVAAQAMRLMDAPTFSDALVHFHAQWLGLDQLQQLVSPSLSEELLADMRTSTERFVVDVFHEDPSLHALLQSDVAFVDDRLAPRYDVPAPGGTGFVRVQVDHHRYSGLLTQASTLVRFSTPTSRGKFVREQLLCSAVPPPPPQVSKQIQILPGQTRRQAYQQHISDPACAPCHTQMDPIGFGFENFDEQGLYRDTDNGLPVDASGQIFTAPGLDGPFQGVANLADKLSSSQVVGQCMAKTWLRYALQRESDAADDCVAQALYPKFANSVGDLRELLLELVKSQQFRFRDAFVVPKPAPVQVTLGPIDTPQKQRKVLLDFAIAETVWLKNVVTKDDLLVLDQYLTTLRDLQVQLSSQLPGAAPAP